MNIPLSACLWPVRLVRHKLSESESPASQKGCVAKSAGNVFLTMDCMILGVDEPQTGDFQILCGRAVADGNGTLDRCPLHRARRRRANRTGYHARMGVFPIAAEHELCVAMLGAKNLPAPALAHSDSWEKT